MSFFSFFRLAWILIIFGLAVYTINALFIKERIQFNLLALLPESQTETMQSVRQLMDETDISRQILILIGHPNSKTSRAGLSHLRQELKYVSLPFLENNTQTLFKDYQDFFQNLSPYRSGLLAEADREMLLHGEGHLLAGRALSQLLMPFSSVGSVQLKNDPFFLYTSFIKSIQPSTSFHQDKKGDLFIQAQGKVWYLFKASLRDTAFSLQTQKDICGKLFPILNHMNEIYDVEILKTGAIFYASAGAKMAQDEISFISLFSTVGIIGLLLFVFRTLRPLLLAISIIMSGLIGGLSACLFIYGSIHILALVFGCSLIGITVDYALHYFCASYRKECYADTGSFGVLKTLMPALFFGALSSIFGYGLLMFAPFPGIQQMALLAAVGLLSAFISVCLWGTCFVNLEQTFPAVGEKIQRHLEKVATFGKKKNHKLFLCIILLSIFCAGVSLLTFEDNIQHFQSLDASLKKEEDQIKSILPIDQFGKFLIIKGKTIEEVLQTEENLKPDLADLKVNKGLSSYRSLAALVPSLKRQKENRKLVELNLYAKYGHSWARTIGRDKDFQITESGLNHSFFALTQSNLSTLPEGWKHLLNISKKGFVVGWILLENVTNEQGLKDMIVKHGNVQYIDIYQKYSHIFASYRSIVLCLIGSVFLVISIFLAFRESIRASVEIVSPVVLSLLASIGIIGLWGMPFTLFHAMGLLMVLCIGIDYALFLYWRIPSKNPGQGKDLHLLANSLAALTTILSFGLLALSSTTAVHSFGVSVFMGIVLCFCVTTLFLGGNNIYEKL